MKDRKETYRQQYEASKQGGESFFPETVARDAVVAALVVGVIIALAVFSPANSEPPANPTSTTYNPRPEWYFLFFFSFLKLFPGSLEPLAAAVIPMVALVILALVPLLDRRPERHWSHRKVTIGIGVLALAFLIVLEVTGALSAPAQPAGEASLKVQSGRRVYQEVNCAYCHSINGIGGSIGPDLSTVGAQLDIKALVTYMQNPHAMVPSTLHPKLQFTQDELNALVAYLQTLGAQVPYTAKAPALFEQYCAACHIVNGKGSAAGPDLSTVGDRRPISFIEAFTSDPKSVISGATMPGFRNSVTQEQINDIAAYLASLKSKPPSPAPAKP